MTNEADRLQIERIKGHMEAQSKAYEEKASERMKAHRDTEREDNMVKAYDSQRNAVSATAKGNIRTGDHLQVHDERARTANEAAIAEYMRAETERQKLAQHAAETEKTNPEAARQERASTAMEEARERSKAAEKNLDWQLQGGGVLNHLGGHTAVRSETAIRVKHAVEEAAAMQAAEELKNERAQAQSRQQSAQANHQAPAAQEQSAASRPSQPPQSQPQPKQQDLTRFDNEPTHINISGGQKAQSESAPPRSQPETRLSPDPHGKELADLVKAQASRPDPLQESDALQKRVEEALKSNPGASEKVVSKDTAANAPIGDNPKTVKTAEQQVVVAAGDDKAVKALTEKSLEPEKLAVQSAVQQPKAAPQLPNKAAGPEHGARGA